MDIEFDTLVEEDVRQDASTAITARSALAYFDDSWYIKASRRTRRMDLIGDYAGNEMFVIDGTSCRKQHVLPAQCSCRRLPIAGSHRWSVACPWPSRWWQILLCCTDAPAYAFAVETSFQILHAFHSLEQLLHGFTRRNAVFEVVFWEGIFA